MLKKCILCLCLMSVGTLLVSGASAQTPVDAVASAVANSGVFPEGTSVVGVTYDDTSAVVDLSGEAITPNFGDALSDAMVEAITDALAEFENIKAIEVNVAGKPLWEYLPQADASAASTAPSLLRAMSVQAPLASGVAALTSELAGRGVGLYPSHGMYWHQGYNRWFVSQRTLCGPNPSPPLPAGWDSTWQSVYQPSNYYYWTKGFQWGSFYEDYRTPQEITFLKAYCESSGAYVIVGRNLDKNAGDFDYNAYGYPNCAYPIPKWATAAKYYLQDIGAPEAVWNEPSLTAQTDKDIRARPYWTNYNMVEPIFGEKKWPLTAAEKDIVKNRPDVWENWVSIHLHTNAAGAGTARGTETYWYTSTYPWLQSKAQALAKSFNDAMINAIKNEYDGFWAEAMYPVGPNPPEWPSGTYRGYDHDGPSTPSTTSGWQDRGVKTSNFGEIREAMVPAVLTELLFHDDWKFYPDHVFAMDRIFQSTVAWGMYEGICNHFGVTPKARLAAAVESIDVPQVVAPGQAFTGAVTVKNLGQAWCWGDKWVDMIYFPYTVWYLAAAAGDPFVPAGTKLAVPNAAPVFPGDSLTFNLTLTAPVTTGQYATEWQMLKDDARGGAFGDVASARIEVANSVGKVTAGGWFDLVGKKATCGFVCEYVDGAAAPTGSLSYQDHDLKMSVQATEMIALGIAGNQAWFYANCTINGEPGHWFRVDVTDNGEPGSADVFKITLDTGYTAGGTLGGGNVQIH